MSNVTIKHGWIMLDKPVGISSAKAVAKVKRLLGIKKAGHAGTLDPLASGMLPIACGEATKTLRYVLSEVKEYAFTICFGEQRDTDDAEGQVIAMSDVMPSQQMLLEVLSQFAGEIDQVPPIFSAIKKDGKRAYDLARRGEDFVLDARRVTVFSLVLTDYDASLRQASFVAECSKGTYIRSLARDIALACGAYGYVFALRRLKIGKIDSKCMILLEKLEEIVHNAQLGLHMLPVDTVLDDIPAVALSPDYARKLQHGQRVPLPCELHMQSDINVIRVFDGDSLIALAEVHDAMIKPVRVFNL